MEKTGTLHFPRDQADRPVQARLHSSPLCTPPQAVVGRADIRQLNAPVRKRLKSGRVL